MKFYFRVYDLGLKQVITIIIIKKNKITFGYLSTQHLSKLSI